MKTKYVYALGRFGVLMGWLTIITAAAVHASEKGTASLTAAELRARVAAFEQDLARVQQDYQLLLTTTCPSDVILARIVDRQKAQTATDTIQRPGVVYDPAINSVRAAPYAQQYSYTEVPVYAYVLTRSTPESLEIVWRYAGTTSVGETRDSGKQLWDDFKTLMKKRSG
jgi:hypothetical protein